MDTETPIEDLSQAPSYPDIQDVAPDIVDGGEGVSVPAQATEPVGVPPLRPEYSNVPAPLEAGDTIPQPGSAPQAVEQGSLPAPATTPATAPSEPSQPAPQAPETAPQVAVPEPASGGTEDQPRRPVPNLFRPDQNGFLTVQRVRSGADVQNLQPSIRSVMSAIVDAKIVPEMEITSGYRDPAHNRRVGGASGSRHLQGDAVDISTRGWSDEQRARVVAAAIQAGARGVGIYPNGGLHFDTRPVPAMWGPNGYGSSDISSFPAWARPALAQLGQGRAIASAAPQLSGVVVGGEGWEEYASRVRQKESGGRDSAANGNAVGRYQFMPGTWNDLARTPEGQAAGLRPIGGGTDPRLDPAQQDAALRVFTQQNAATLTRNGLEVNAANLYMLHFLGAGGGPRFLRLLRENPDLPAANVFATEAEANRTIFYTNSGRGRARSLREVFEFQTGQVVAGAPLVSTQRRVTDPLGPADMSRPPALVPGQQYTDADRAAIQAARGEERRSFFQLVGDAFSRETPEGALAGLGPAFLPVAGWATKENLSPFYDQMPKGYERRLEQALSPAQAEWIVQRAKRDASIDAAFEEAGWTGTAASVAANFLSPSTWALGIASGGLGTVLAGGSRVGARVAGAAIGAAGNVAYEGGVAALQSDEYGPGEILGAAVVGAVFGAAFGPVGQNPATANIAAGIAGVARRIEADEAVHVRGPGSVGAARTISPEMPEQTTVAEWRALRDEAVPRGSGSGVANALRISLGGDLANSENVGTRMIASGTFVDVVGKGEAVNPHTADQLMVMLNQRYQATYKSFIDVAYTEWATEQGIDYVRRAGGYRRAEFMTEVGRAILGYSDAEIAQLPPQIQRVVAHHGRWVQERLDELKDPGRALGAPRGEAARSVEGSRSVEKDPRYFPVRWAINKIDSYLADSRVGYTRLEDLISGAIKKAQPQIEDDLSRRLASAVLVGARKRAGGVDDGLVRAMSQGDVEKLKTMLRDEHNWEDDVLDRLVQRLDKGQPGRDGFLQRRIPMNYNARIQLPDGTELRVMDLLDTNAEQVMDAYSRKVAGRVALANVRLVNPETGGILFDGITSDADWAALLQQAARKAMDSNNPRLVEAWKREQELLQFGYDRILGRPHPAAEAMGQVGEWIRVVRSFNHARLMGLMGLTSLADIGRLVGSGGFRAAYQQMRAFRRIVTMDGRRILQEGLDRELEAAFGLGTDALRGYRGQLMADEFVGPNGDRLVDKARRFTDAAAGLTNTLSGQNLVQSTLELWAGRISAQRFADIAAKGSLTKSERNLVNFLGLDQSMLDRVLRQVRSHYSTVDGSIYGRKVTQMNLDKWDDLEARAAFEQSLFRFVRTSVQQNDIGSLHRVMSHPMAQLMLQFRSFSLVAHENQFLQGIAMGDGRQLQMALNTVISGALVYAVQSHLQAIGRSDADKFLEDRGFAMRGEEDFRKLGLSIFQRAGFSGLLPMAVDSALMFTPMDPMFSARSTGNPSDIIFGNPTTGLLKSAAGASRSLVDGFTSGRDLTQAELRQAFSTVVLQNLLGVSNVFSLMISDRPER